MKSKKSQITFLVEYYIGTVLLFFLLFPSLSVAKEVPSLSGPVVDEAGTLTLEQNNSLSNAIREYYQSSGHQLEVLIIESLAGDNLEEYSIRVGEKWKIGGKDSTGVILIVSLVDRKIRIEVGGGAEGMLTDAQAGRIISDLITPYFKQGNYFSGIAAGLSSIAESLGGKLPLDSKNINSYPRVQIGSKGASVLFFFLFMLVFVVLRVVFMKRGGGGLLMGILLGSMLGRGGGGGGGFSGGGGWSGGGGGFSGGGASGGW